MPHKAARKGKNHGWGLWQPPQPLGGRCYCCCCCCCGSQEVESRRPVASQRLGVMEMGRTDAVRGLHKILRKARTADEASGSPRGRSASDAAAAAISRSEAQSRHLAIFVAARRDGDGANTRAWGSPTRPFRSPNSGRGLGGAPWPCREVRSQGSDGHCLVENGSGLQFWTGLAPGPCEKRIHSSVNQ